MLALDKQFSEMETEIQTLKTENLHLRAQVRPLEEQIERLKKQLEPQKAPAHTLEQTEIDIIKLLSAHKRLDARAIAGALQLHPLRIEHFLTSLEKKDFVQMVLEATIDGGIDYELSERGIAYAVKAGFV